MITFIFAFTGAMIGSVVINYVLHANNPNWEEPIQKENYDD
jgi:hypothetical protein